MSFKYLTTAHLEKTRIVSIVFVETSIAYSTRLSHFCCNGVIGHSLGINLFHDSQFFSTPDSEDDEVYFKSSVAERKLYLRKMRKSKLFLNSACLDYPFLGI